MQTFGVLAAVGSQPHGTVPTDSEVPSQHVSCFPFQAASVEEQQLLDRVNAMCRGDTEITMQAALAEILEFGVKVGAPWLGVAVWRSEAVPPFPHVFRMFPPGSHSPQLALDTPSASLVPALFAQPPPRVLVLFSCG
jgi:hypothetical protein